nr:hypothetical protein [Tanacetum cinerariifolium]
MSWFSSCSNCGGLFNGGNCPSCSIVGSGNEFFHGPNPLPYDNTSDFSYQPPQHHVDTYSCELCANDSHYGYDSPPWRRRGVSGWWQRLLPWWQQVAAATGVGDGAAVVNGSGLMMVTGAWPESGKKRRGAGCVAAAVGGGRDGGWRVT